MWPKIEVAPDHLETAYRCGAYYECPKDGDGRRLGPLVAYAGDYEVVPGGKREHFVGDVYFNFALIEPFSNVLKHFASCLAVRLLQQLPNIDTNNLVFCGAPLGGYDLARAMAFEFSAPAIKQEKKVTVAGSAVSKEESKIVFGRHRARPGDEVVLVEDVVNNFKTTDPMIDNVVSYEASVVAILCCLNRSLKFDDAYQSSGMNFPIVSLIRKPYPEWRQNDTAVAGDIVSGNVAWNPKKEWGRLMEAMESAKKK